MRFAAAAALLLCAPSAFAAGALARAAAVRVSGEDLIVGAANPRAEKNLDCAQSAVQRTIRRCRLKTADAPDASFLGRPVAGAALNVHFQGEIVNMSVELGPGAAADATLAQLRALLPGKPKLEYWADDERLFASYIWVDGEAEVELTTVVKGPAGDGKVRVYVSSLLGDRPLSPDDAPR